MFSIEVYQENLSTNVFEWIGRTFEGRGQEANMDGLVAGDGLQVIVEILVEASVGELLHREVGETFAVELVLEVLKCEGIVENIG